MTKRRLRKGNYRKIYIENFGAIPKDEDGRSYDIHHKDGDPNNNDPGNLVALSIQEHYDTHHQQGDWDACYLIALRMIVPPQLLSELASKRERQKIANGTHHWVGPSYNQRLKDEGRHPWVGGKQSSKNARKLVAEGRHPFSGGEIQREANARRIKNGTHNWLGGDKQRHQLKEGTHNFQKRKQCPYCDYENNSGNVALHIKRKHAA